MQITSLQLGVDIATSLAILASAITFLINQRLKNRETKRRQLDESVRAVTVNEFQAALGTLSTLYIKQIVVQASPLHNATSRGTEKLSAMLENRPEYLDTLKLSLKNTSNNISDFFHTICAYNYQITPLLDSIEDGQKQITEFREGLAQLMHSYNHLNASHMALLDEVCTLATYCHEHPIESADQDVLRQMVLSILTDTDYRQWVDSFIPAGKEDLYWQHISQKDFGEHASLLSQVHTNLLQHFYTEPNQMKAQVLGIAYHATSQARQHCKDFLIKMSALNYWLIRKGGSDETLEDVIARYRSPDVFAATTEIR